MVTRPYSSEIALILQADFFSGKAQSSHGLFISVRYARHRPSAVDKSALLAQFIILNLWKGKALLASSGVSAHITYE